MRLMPVARSRPGVLLLLVVVESSLLQNISISCLSSVLMATVRTELALCDPILNLASLLWVRDCTPVVFVYAQGLRRARSCERHGSSR